MSTKKKVKNIMKWLARVLLGIFALLVLFVLLFYLFRGRIKDKVLDYVNDSQPGEVLLDKINLRPFMHFPDISLQLKDLEYYSAVERADTVPVLSLEDVYLSLDVVKLIKKSYEISKIRIGDGVINYTVTADSVSNLEYALGIRFGVADSLEATSEEEENSPIFLDLESLELRNLELNYSDYTAQTNISLLIHGLESNFSYYPERILAGLMTHFDLEYFAYRDIQLDKPRSVSLSTSLNYDLLKKQISLEKSLMHMQDVMLEIGGNIDLREDADLQLEFRAQNSGIELLNFLFQGVLDLDAIEQIGEGHIELAGEINGTFTDKLPLISVNFLAEDIGFYVKAIDQSVTEISFAGYATNGEESDYSDLEFKLDHFHASFPQGELNAMLTLRDLLRPQVELDIKGEAELSLLNEIIKSETVYDMHGMLVLDGLLYGRIDKQAGMFFNDGGAVVAEMHDVGMNLPGYVLQSLNGEIIFMEKDVEFRDVAFMLDSNSFDLNGKFTDILPYFAGFDSGAEMNMTFASPELQLDKLLKDTAMAGKSVKDLSFRLSAAIEKAELDRAIKQGEIPNLEIGLQQLHIDIPEYNDIAVIRLMIELADDMMLLRDFHGRIGDSQFSLAASLSDYKALLEKDTLAELKLDFLLESDQMKAEDLLTFNGEFKVLPKGYRAEEILDFIFEGELETTVSELLFNNSLPFFRFSTQQLEWSFLHYPLPFKDFSISMEQARDQWKVHRFSGMIGESSFQLSADIGNLLDTIEAISGTLDIKSDLLDINELLNYDLMSTEDVAENTDSTLSNEPSGLNQIAYPDLALNLDINELRYGGNLLYGLSGRLRSKPYKVIYLDRFALQAESGGTVVVDGQFNVADPKLYMLSAKFDIDTVNVSDFDLQLNMNDSVFSLSENFNGLLSADGIAEFYLKPDFSIDLDYSTAMFNLRLEDGMVRNFTPLHALAKFTGNKDLDNIKFGLLRNSFTLMSGVVQIPLMSIESTLGLLLLEGEQKFDGDFLYLARVPMKLVRGTAWNILSNQQRKESNGENEVEEMRAQKFLMVTIAGTGGEEEVKMGDKRDKYSEE